MCAFVYTALVAVAATYSIQGRESVRTLWQYTAVMANNKAISQAVQVAYLHGVLQDVVRPGIVGDELQVAVGSPDSHDGGVVWDDVAVTMSGAVVLIHLASWVQDRLS